MGVHDYGKSDRFAYARKYPLMLFQYNDSTAGTRNVTVPAGWYYPFYTASYNGIPGIYHYIFETLNTILAGTASANRLDAEFATPSGATNPFFVGAGLRIYRKAGALNYTFIGNGATARSVIGQGITQTFSQTVEISRNLVQGIWTPPVATCDRRDHRVRETFRNEAGRISYSNWWDERTIRSFLYRNVPASHVRYNPYPSTQEVMPAIWDGRPGLDALSTEPPITNSFADMWKSTLQGGYPIAAIYDVSGIPSKDVVSWAAEKLKPRDAQWEEETAIATNFGTDEHYSLQFQCEVIP